MVVSTLIITLDNYSAFRGRHIGAIIDDDDFVTSQQGLDNCVTSDKSTSTSYQYPHLKTR